MPCSQISSSGNFGQATGTTRVWDERSRLCLYAAHRASLDEPVALCAISARTPALGDLAMSWACSTGHEIPHPLAHLASLSVSCHTPGFMQRLRRTLSSGKVQCYCRHTQPGVRSPVGHIGRLTQQAQGKFLCWSWRFCLPFMGGCTSFCHTHMLRATAKSSGEPRAQRDAVAGPLKNLPS